MEEENIPGKLTIIKQKSYDLWADNRKYKSRLILSAIITLSVCFTFLFFGPVEITAFSQNSLVFNVQTALPLMALFSFVVFIVTTLILSLLKGKIFDYCMTTVFSLLISGYLQGNFLNGNLGALTGDAINWQDNKSGMFLNLLIWFVIFIVLFLVLYLNKKLWTRMLQFVPAALVIMQSVALISIFTGNTAAASSHKDNTLTTEDLGTYAPKNNTLVFLLDRFDYDYLEMVQRDDPDFFNKLDGFTQYTNAISEHARTIPAVTYLFTNTDLSWKVPKDVFFEKSWYYNGKNLLKDLKSADYTLDFYTDINCIFGSGNSVKDYVSNLSGNNKKLNAMNLINNLTSLSGYRYMPTALKPFFWCYTDDVNQEIYKDTTVYQIDETKYDKEDLKISNDNNKYFKFYHFMGSHAPYTLNQDGSKSKDTTTVTAQTEGSFNILFRAFNKMKALGIYKNANIIITADHGNAVSDTEPLQKANRIGFFYKPAGNADTPLTYSKAPISFKNVPATIAKWAGLNYHPYGTPIDEVKESDNVVRTFYKTTINAADQKENVTYVYQITGDAADFSNWKMIRQENVKFSLW